MMYRGLSAQLYDLFLGDSLPDIAFYRHFLEQTGKALEIGCGTGRLLLPLMQEGFAIEGVDSSMPMLELCRRKAERLSLNPVLYHQAMQDLSLPDRYTTIFIPFCSFMLIEHDKAVQALKRFYDHLVPGGQLLISLYLPWQELLGYQPGTWRLRRQRTTAEGDLILCHEALLFKPWQQVQQGLFRYEIYKNGELAQQYMEEITMRWYGKDEMSMMLKEAGFTVQAWYGDYTFEPAADHHETLVVHAIRR